MLKPTDDLARAWALPWSAAGLALARARAEEIERVDLQRVADELEEALLTRVRDQPAPHASGLIEQQRIFARARRR